MPKLHEDSPSVRDEANGHAGRDEAKAEALSSPAVRLAIAPAGEGGNAGVRQNEINLKDYQPALLVSYYYLEPFLKNKARYSYRDWALDSGAFSAHNSGAEINLQDYIECCKQQKAEDPTLTDIFALDVIGDWKASLHNTEEMWKRGVEAIPTFHYGEPWDYLKGIAKDYPKIALGGCVGKRDKDKFAGQVFARVWPCKIHGFGFGSEKSILSIPFHSVDATNWEMGPCAYGRWASFGKIGNANISVRGSKQNLRAEVEYYLDLERRARDRWRKEMKILDGLPLTLRLAVDAGAANGQRAEGAFVAPTLRLAHGGDATAVSNRGSITRMKSFGKPGADQTLIIIPCGGKKREETCSAGEMYVGPYHKACRAWADSLGGRVLILSAKYGLLRLDEEIIPYDLRMGQAGSVTPGVVRKQLEGLGIEDFAGEVIALGGKEYTNIIKAIWPTCKTPLEGLGGIGKQLSWLLNQTRDRQGR